MTFDEGASCYVDMIFCGLVTSLDHSYRGDDRSYCHIRSCMDFTMQLEMLAGCSGYVWLFFMYSIGAVCTSLKFWDRKMSPCEFFWLSSQCGYSLRLHSF